MATSKSKLQHRSSSELCDHEDGKAINPNIPSYITSTPWYLHAKGSLTTKGPGPVRSLKHQRNWKKALASTPYDAKRDRWSGYDARNYASDVVARYEARDEARSNFVKQQQQQNLQGHDHEKDDFKIGVTTTTQTTPTETTETTTTTYSRARKDIPTYLISYYNSISNPPPPPTTLPNTQKKRISGPLTQAGFLNMNYKISKDMLKSQAKTATTTTTTTAPVEEVTKSKYDEDTKSKYDEDVFVNNHTSVWGSWWKDNQWGYKCCKQTVRNSNCTAVPEVIKAVEEPS